MGTAVDAGLDGCPRAAGSSTVASPEHALQHQQNCLQPTLLTNESSLQPATLQMASTSGLLRVTLMSSTTKYSGGPTRSLSAAGGEACSAPCTVTGMRPAGRIIGSSYRRTGSRHGLLRPEQESRAAQDACLEASTAFICRPLGLPSRTLNAAPQESKCCQLSSRTWSDGAAPPATA